MIEILVSIIAVIKLGKPWIGSYSVVKRDMTINALSAVIICPVQMKNIKVTLITKTMVNQLEVIWPTETIYLFF